MLSQTFRSIALSLSLLAALLAGTAALAQTSEWTRTTDSIGRITHTSPSGAMRVTEVPAVAHQGASASNYLDAYIEGAFPGARIGEATLKDDPLLSTATRKVRPKGASDEVTVWTAVRPGISVRTLSMSGKPASTDEARGLAALLVAINGAPASSAPSRTPASPKASPPARFAARDIDRVVHSFGKKRYNSVSGLWTFRDEGIYVLFKDGWTYRMPDTGLADFDLDASRRGASKRWVRTRDLPEAVTSAKPLRPHAKGERISLDVQRPDVSGTMGMSTVTTSGLKLSPDGRFEISRFSLTSAAFGAPPTMGTGFGGGIDTSDTARGSYALDGYGITLTFDSGERVESLFATRGSDTAVLGNTYYWTKR